MYHYISLKMNKYMYHYIFILRDTTVRSHVTRSAQLLCWKPLQHSIFNTEKNNPV